jgi:pyruvate formate lyase activating enzyme
MDPARHRSETGSDNRLILDNLRLLSENDVEVWIRLPLIPGFNDDPANIEATGAFLAGLPRRHRVFVLPYHGIANGKRSRMGETDDRSNLRTPGAEELDAVARALATRDFQVTVGGSP